METVFFTKGLIVGFITAAPLGPIGILCARRTLTHGRRAAFVSGMGAATADSIYGFIAAFGLTFVSDLLIEHQPWLRLVGGILLCFIGIKTFLANAEVQRMPSTGRQYAGMYTSTLFLTLTNPATILSLAAVFAGLGLAGARGSILPSAILILGVFLGSILWWLVLIGVFTILKRKFSDNHLLWVNRISGLIITLSGILLLLFSKN